MRLLVDAGNTAVKWGLYEAGTMTASDRMVHRGHDIAACLDRSWGGLQRPAAAFVANVAGEDMAVVLGDWMQRHWSLTPDFATTSGAACGVTNAYPVAGDLGVDRWAALVAAHHHYPGAACIIDCGTAITVDVLAADGRHRGGLILPGIGMLEQAVYKDTAGVRSSGEVEAATLLASSTAAGVYGGAMYMTVAALDRVTGEIADSLALDFALVITGGDAGRILTLLARSAHHDPALVLKGLALLAGEH